MGVNEASTSPMPTHTVAKVSVVVLGRYKSSLRVVPVLRFVNVQLPARFAEGHGSSESTPSDCVQLLAAVASVQPAM